MFQTRLIFVAQVALCCVVIFQSYAKYHTNSITLGFWLLASICVQIPAFLNRGVDSQVGRTWPVEEFLGLMKINRYVHYRFGDDGPYKTYSDCELLQRFIGGFIVNTLIRDVLIFITPLVLMQAQDGMELVQNALALTFIAVMDDLGEGKTVKIAVRTYTPPDMPTWQVLVGEIEEANAKAQEEGILCGAEWHRVWGMVLMFSFPLAMWLFGFFFGFSLTQRPGPLWFLLWFLSFFLDCLLVLVPKHY
mmetsp:Transcript_3472/g.8074  ORF Transcript_3472/g.8074 Transcript_3472/m.8074 type:complete len:248 (+) Transcript_3472:604-1347(+)